MFYGQLNLTQMSLATMLERSLNMNANSYEMVMAPINEKQMLLRKLTAQGGKIGKDGTYLWH